MEMQLRWTWHTKIAWQDIYTSIAAPSLSRLGESIILRLTSGFAGEENRCPGLGNLGNMGKFNHVIYVLLLHVTLEVDV